MERLAPGATPTQETTTPQSRRAFPVGTSPGSADVRQHTGSAPKLQSNRRQGTFSWAHDWLCKRERGGGRVLREVRQRGRRKSKGGRDGRHGTRTRRRRRKSALPEGNGETFGR